MFVLCVNLWKYITIDVEYKSGDFLFYKIAVMLEIVNKISE